MSDNTDLLSPDNGQTAGQPEVDASQRIDLAAQDEISRADPTLFARENVEPPFTRTVLTTSLHMNVAAESRTNLWTQWNGYTTPDVLTTIEDEYRALRHAAVLADVSPLFKYRITGQDATAYLARLVTGNLVSLSVNETMPVVFCEDHGLVVGDGLLFRIAESEYRLITECAHLAWLTDSAIGMRAVVEDVTTSLAALSLQGPLSCAVLHEAGLADVEALRPFAARWFEVLGMPVYVSRTGNSGDLGYELWIDPEDAPSLWLKLLERGADFGVRAGGFASREIARIEAGLPRAGLDYLGAFSAVDPANASTPFELGFESLVDLDRNHFTGRDALRAMQSISPRHILATLAVDWGEPLHFVGIRDERGIAGVATSRAFSPSLGINLALARLSSSAMAGAPSFHIEVEVMRELGLSLLRAPARIVTGPVLSLPARHLVPAPIMSGR